ncbi:MAG: DUF4382 domain-containing protein [Betaproteobacteria bacterium]|nr:MAG: DUF4382 domain-containing protein [Betaproteobacteria bacterium]
MFRDLLNFRRYAAAAGAIAASALLVACGSGGGGGGAESGTLRLALTDRPACGYDAVFVTIQKVRVHQSGTAGESDAGWSEIVLTPAKRVDLVTLQNGVLAELGQTPLPTGKYTQLRLVLAANDATTPLANSVIPTGGTETPLTTPSAFQTGLKLNVNIDVEADKLADFVLDFEACRSVVKRGNSGEYNLKPVVSVTPRIFTGIIGFVHTALAVGTTEVSAQLAGVPIKSTTPDATGKFVLGPIADGNYDIVVAAAGRATATVVSVPASSAANTVLNDATTPIDPPVSVTHTVSGTVTITPAVTPIDAVVVARKIYTGGPTVEVAGGPVDGDTGAFSYVLPSGAPVKSAFVTPLAFAVDGATPTGNYTLVATTGALAPKSLVVNLTTADVSGANFAFP